jgi:hypothetical protein
MKLKNNVGVRMRKRVLFSFLWLTLFATTTVLAQSPPGNQDPQGKKWISKLDTNGDGKISKSEYLKACEDRFKAIDQDNDGFIDEKDQAAMEKKMEEHIEKMREKMKEGATHGMNNIQDGAEAAMGKAKQGMHHMMDKTSDGATP